MSDSIRTKATTLIQSLDRRYGKSERPAPMPPPASADAGAIAAVSAKNSQIVAGVVLGLHGPPGEGIESARKLMQHFVDWNEVRVSRPPTLAAVLGRQSRAAERIALLQRFLEAFFLRQRSLYLDVLFTLKPSEARRFLGDLEVFDREELAAVLLCAFGQPFFPPSDALREIAEKAGLARGRTTTLQMAKKFETVLEAPELYDLYSHLYSLAQDPDSKSVLSRKKSSR